MREDLEFQGRNLKKAVQDASKTLNIPEAEIKYKIVVRGATGIFGLVGHKNAIIRVIPPQSEEKEEKRSWKKDKKKKKQDFPKKADTGMEEAPRTPSHDGNAYQLDAQNLITEIAESITEDVSVTMTERREQISFEIGGKNPALLIGKRGQTLEAIQYVVEKAINKRNERRIRVQVDVEGYIKRRKLKVVTLARRQAQKAKHSGKPVTIGQMNPTDRRIIHMALKKDKDVRTQSEGDGYIRKIRVYPVRSD